MEFKLSDKVRYIAEYNSFLKNRTGVVEEINLGNISVRFEIGDTTNGLYWRCYPSSLEFVCPKLNVQRRR